MQEDTRRQFLGKSAALVIGTTGCLCGLGGCATYTKIGSTPAMPEGTYRLTAGGRRLEVELAEVPQLAAVGGSVKLRDAGLPQPLIIARTGEGAYVAAALECTHRGVEVAYQAEQGEFECESLGGSQFALDGARLGGPATEPLRVFATSLDPKAAHRLVIDLSD